MQSDPVKPVLELPIQAGSGGGWGALPVSFSPSGDRLIVQVPTSLPPPYYWWRFHKADVAATIALLSVILLFLLIRRGLRRGRRRDRLYCRQCNYDLSPGDGGSIAAACPECGAPTSRKSPLRGRPLFLHLLPVMGVLLPVLVMSVVLWKSGVESKTRSNVAWPLEPLSKMTSWPFARRTIYPIQSRTFDTYSLPDAQKLCTSTIAVDPWEGRLTGDLRSYTYVQFNGSTRAVVFDPATGASRSVDLGGTSIYSKFHGYTPDETEAIFTNLALPDKSGKCTAILLCLNLQTMKLREIARVEVIPQSTGPDAWMIPTLAAAVCNNPSKWALMPVNGPTGGQLDYGTIGEPSKRVGSNSVSMPMGAWVHSLSYTKSGQLMLQGDTEIIPETGAMRISSSTPPVLTASLPANILSISKNSSTAYSFPVEPAFAGAHVLGSPALSLDGRWLVVQILMPRPPPQISQARCLIFDTTKIKPLPQAIPNN